MKRKKFLDWTFFNNGYTDRADLKNVTVTDITDDLWVKYNDNGTAMEAKIDREFPSNVDADTNTGVTGILTIQTIPSLQPNTSGTTSGYTMVILNEDDTNVTAQCTFVVERSTGSGTDLSVNASGVIYTNDPGTFYITATHSDYNTSTNPGAKDRISVRVLTS